MKKRLHGLLALLLAVVTMFTAMPMEVQAEETLPELTGTVTIMKDGEEVSVIRSGDEVTAVVTDTPEGVSELTYKWMAKGDGNTPYEVRYTATCDYSGIPGDVLWCEVTATGASGTIKSNEYTIEKAFYSGNDLPQNGVVDDYYGTDTFTFAGHSNWAYEYRTRKNTEADWTDWASVDSVAGSGVIEQAVTIGNVNRAADCVQVRAKENDYYVTAEEDYLSNTTPFTAVLAGTVSLTGEAAVGGMLTANASLEAPLPDENIDLQYTFKCGDAVVQETSASNSYIPGAADVGKQITVEVTATNASGSLSAISEQIQKMTAEISGAVVTGRAYDGATAANVESVSFKKAGSEEIGIDMEKDVDYRIVSATYDSADAGTNKTVTIKIELLGDATNEFTLASDTITVQNQTITPKSFTLSNGSLQVKNGVAQEYQFDLSTLLPAEGVAAGEWKLGEVKLPADYYTAGASVVNGVLKVPVLAASSQEGEIGTIAVMLDCGSNYAQADGGVITVVAEKQEPVAEEDEEDDEEDDEDEWDELIDELENIPEGQTVTLNLGDDTIVPGDVFDSIKGRDVNIILNLGNGLSWTINGKSITSDEVPDIDFGVSVGGDTIPVDVLNLVTGERFVVNVSLKYSGEFGLTAILNVNLDAKNKGLYANLFYYNEPYNVMQFMNADMIDENGMAHLVFTHASEYAIVIDKVIMGNSVVSPKTGEEAGVMPYALLVATLVSVFVGLELLSKQRKDASK